MERTAQRRAEDERGEAEAPTAATATATAVQPAMADSPAEQVIALQRSAGNAAVSGLIARREAEAEGGEAFSGVGGFLTLAATAVGARAVELQGSVGRGGKNRPDDVQEVRARLLGLGSTVGPEADDLAEAIEAYQRDVVGLRRPDGRIDPGGRTLGALVQQRAKPAPAAEQQTGPEAADAPAAAPDAADAAAPTPGAPAKSADTAAPVVSGPLKDLVAAANAPAVDAAASKLAGMQQRFAKMERGKELGLEGDKMEEVGAARDQLVQDIEDLRAAVAGFSALGLPAAQLKALQAAFYRGLNTVTPFYFQNNNVIWEASKDRDKDMGIKRAANFLYFKTCNITSLAMALEGLGKTAADYEHLPLIDQIADLFANEFGTQAGDVTKPVTDTDYTGLRLPEFLSMAVILHTLDYKVASREQLIAAIGRGAKEITKGAVLRDVAKKFGVAATSGGTEWADELNEYGLEKVGGKRRSSLVDAGGAAQDVIDDGGIEADVPLQAYKQKVMKALGKALDSGQQVVVSQANHFVKLQSVDDAHVIKDDPGGYMGADEKLSWEEARAVGLFRSWILLG